MHWLKRLRHSKVRFLFSGGGYTEEPNVPHTTNAADDVRDGAVRALDVRGATVSGGTNSMDCHTAAAAAAVSISAPLSCSVSLSSFRQLSVRHDICGGAKSQESKRKPFPKALFPPPPEMTDEMEGESEETRTKRIKEMKKSLKREAKAAKMGETKDEGEWGTYDDPDSEDEEDEGKEEEEEVRHDSIISLLTSISFDAAGCGRIAAKSYISNVTPLLHRTSYHCYCRSGRTKMRTVRVLSW